MRTILFDLDGTIIDSKRSILKSIEWTLKKNKNETKIKLDERLVGPSLEEIYNLILGNKNNKIIIEDFKNYYDNTGYKLGRPYKDIDKLIKKLFACGYILYIVTNKRINISKKILDFFSLSKYFKAIYTLDSEKKISKQEVISSLIKKNNIDIKNTIYIGDRLDDYRAAMFNNIKCIIVGWGYGVATDDFTDINIIKSQNEILEFIKNN